jgi:hypothetical protein
MPRLVRAWPSDTWQIRVVSMAALGAFSWRWPEATEAFARGWGAVADVDGLPQRLKGVST